ncbi:hypothetical protein SACS_1526 [Parasaccharibacter apium]|uniref:Uncharacterized protein n=1 Tax=Parasaccharibacter apium TaxID=1510841 RepID=A0A7U7J1C6_9PROT|nr:hypothetical protein SACS_1526 [Parasaccharibacter apium]
MIGWACGLSSCFNHGGEQTSWQFCFFDGNGLFRVLVTSFNCE